MLEIEELLFKMVSIPSVNSTVGEIEVGKFIYEYLLKLRSLNGLSDENFLVFLQDLADDHLGRKNVIAVLKGRKGYSNNAIVFLGHFDTVDVEDYGSLRD
ncbi:MAG: peptidase M20, partial [Candidatus Calescibacterium sp.]|nr:peptidase M20 [Candidatus Calescibacterium sp.]